MFRLSPVKDVETGTMPQLDTGPARKIWKVSKGHASLMRFS